MKNILEVYHCGGQLVKIQNSLIDLDEIFYDIVLDVCTIVFIVIWDGFIFERSYELPDQFVFSMDWVSLFCKMVSRSTYRLSTSKILSWMIWKGQLGFFLQIKLRSTNFPDSLEATFVMWVSSSAWRSKTTPRTAVSSGFNYVSRKALTSLKSFRGLLFRTVLFQYSCGSQVWISESSILCCLRYAENKTSVFENMIALNESESHSQSTALVLLRVRYCKLNWFSSSPRKKSFSLWKTKLISRACFLNMIQKAL